MLDVHLNTFSSTFVTETREVTKTVHEHRAPTDESIKMLREMEDKARQQVEKGIRLENCAVDAIIYAMHDAMNAQKKFKVIYAVNGNRHEAIFDLDEWRYKDREDRAIALITGIRDALASSIAKEVLYPAFEKLDQQGLLFD